MRVRLGWMALVAAVCAAFVTAWGAPRTAAVAAEHQLVPAPAVSATTLPALPETPAPLMTSAPISAPSPSGILAPPGSLIQVTGAVAAPTILTLKDLQAMRRSTVTLRVLDPDGKRRVHIFTGPTLSDIVNAAKPTTSTGLDMATHAYAYVTGSTGSSAIVAFAEFNTDYNGKRILIAYEEDGRPLPGAGIGELIVPEDATQGRFISGVTTIEIGTP
jgi:DMSO/TMAO reductase YedYZ molybdopterin-dependent catalytic subunit